MEDKNPSLHNKTGDNIDILKDLATLDPLDDRALKILLSDDEQFVKLAEAFMEQKLDEDSIVDINGELTLSVKGRLIRLDALRDTNLGFINMEGQIESSSFPFKRHLFYGAFIYATGIQKSDSFHDLKPVVSIVVYKEKGEAELIDKAYLAGGLVKTEDDSKQLTLIAINTKKWREAPTEELRTYLSTFHHGIITEENKSDFNGVDINSTTFKSFQRAVRMACAQTKQQEYKEKGDDYMAKVYTSFLTDEERIAAEEKGELRGRLEGKIEGKLEGKMEGKIEGKIEGKALAIEIFRLLKAGIPVPEIARKCNVTPSEVEEFRIVL